MFIWFYEEAGSILPPSPRVASGGLKHLTTWGGGRENLSPSSQVGRERGMHLSLPEPGTALFLPRRGSLESSGKGQKQHHLHLHQTLRPRGVGVAMILRPLSHMTPESCHFEIWINLTCTLRCHRRNCCIGSGTSECQGRATGGTNE